MVSRDELSSWKIMQPVDSWSLKVTSPRVMCHGACADLNDRHRGFPERYDFTAWAGMPNHVSAYALSRDIYADYVKPKHKQF
jgi:hypothetical protein